MRPPRPLADHLRTTCRPLADHFGSSQSAPPSRFPTSMKQEWQRSWSKGAWPAARTGTKRAWSSHVAGAASRAADWHGTEWQSNGSGDTWKRARARGSRGGQERRQEWVAGQSHGGGGPAIHATCLAVVPWTAPVSVRPTQPLALTETAASSSAAATLETQVAVMPVDAH